MGIRLYSASPDSWAEVGAPKAIYTVNLISNEISQLPGSEGFYSPRWSPDGRYVVAMPLDEKKLVLFDFATLQWDLAALPHIGSPQWSPDSNYIYVRYPTLEWAGEQKVSVVRDILEITDEGIGIH
ncbi:TolB family protein [Edaphobacter aggregans]|uniref:TolB family protein n=1 Tax=Edaphobacter aggregans TaxID=570835 RepID=UPI0005599386|nr:PD40 domain-containing protein [Edaphobacter aggregans]